MVTKTQSSLASRLRHRITIEAPVKTADGAGGFTSSWNSFAEVWAEILPKNAVEKFSDEHIEMTKRITVTIRHVEGITRGMRIKYGERVFNIQTILNPYEENILLEIGAQEE